MMTKRIAAALVGLLFTFPFGGVGFGYILRQTTFKRANASDLIVGVKVIKTDEGGGFSFAVQDVIKGSYPSQTLNLDFNLSYKGDVEVPAVVLKKDEECILFLKKQEESQKWIIYGASFGIVHCSQDDYSENTMTLKKVVGLTAEEGADNRGEILNGLLRGNAFSHKVAIDILSLGKNLSKKEYVNSKLNETVKTMLISKNIQEILYGIYISQNFEIVSNVKLLALLILHDSEDVWYSAGMALPRTTDVSYDLPRSSSLEQRKNASLFWQEWATNHVGSNADENSAALPALSNSN